MVFFTPNIESPTASFTSTTVNNLIINGSTAVSGNFYVYDSVGEKAIVVDHSNNTRTLNDGLGGIALDWRSRTLYDQNIIPVLTYSNISSSNGVRLYGTASFALSSSTTINSATASYVNPLNQIVFITGGLNILNQTTNNSVKITSGSTDVFTITGSGVTVLGTLNSPPAVVGGMYFNGSDFFLGF